MKTSKFCYTVPQSLFGINSRICLFKSFRNFFSPFCMLTSKLHGIPTLPPCTQTPSGALLDFPVTAMCFKRHEMFVTYITTHAAACRGAVTFGNLLRHLKNAATFGWPLVSKLYGIPQLRAYPRAFAIHNLS